MEETPSMRFGTFVHAGKLEPELLAENYVVVPDQRFVTEVERERPDVKSPRATTLYKEKVKQFLALHAGKIPMTDDEFTKLAVILRRLRTHGICKQLFQQGIPELTIIWDQNVNGHELRCKGRIDWLSLSKSRPPASVDLKTTNDLLWFNIGKWEYHRQAAFSLYGSRRAWKACPPKQRGKYPKQLDTHYIAAIETVRPHAVRCAAVHPNDIVLGTREFFWCLEVIEECLRKQRWPGPNDPSHWQLYNYQELGGYVPDTDADEE